MKNTKKINPEDVARYIIGSPFLLYEDGYYYARYSHESGLTYEENADIYASTPVSFPEDFTRWDLDAWESLENPDFLRVCEKLARQINDEL